MFLPCVQLSYDMYLVFGGTENFMLKPLVVFAYNYEKGNNAFTQ